MKTNQLKTFLQQLNQSPYRIELSANDEVVVITATRGPERAHISCKHQDLDTNPEYYLDRFAELLPVD